MPLEPYEQIELPAELSSQSGLEVLRVGVVDSVLQVVLKRCFDEPGAWGAAAAEILQYAAKIYASETDIAAEDALGRMVETFMTMIMKPVDGESVVIREN
jgi:hypothetical protein